MNETQHIVNTDILLKSIGKKEIKPIFETINSQREYLGEWLPFVEYTLKETDTRDFINSVNLKETRDLTFAIYYKDYFAGLISLKEPDYDNKKVEIGYWLAENFQHLGIITLSGKYLINEAFSKLGFNRIQLKAATENLKSQRVAERLGFIKEGIERDGELHKNGFVDLIVYGLLKKDWLCLSENYF